MVRLADFKSISVDLFRPIAVVQEFPAEGLSLIMQSGLVMVDIRQIAKIIEMAWYCIVQHSTCTRYHES